MTAELENRIISASDLTSYVVCPEAWRLKYEGKGKRKHSARVEEGKQLRKEWVEKHDLAAQLRLYSKIVYLCLVVLAIIVFLLEPQRLHILGGAGNASHEFLGKINSAFASIQQRVFVEIYLLLAILGLLIFLWDLFDRRSKAFHKSSGLDEGSSVVALSNSAYLPSKTFSSSSSKLTSRPDALVKEGGTLIPVDIHPLTNKVKDRHVIQVLLHCRLIQETENITPPYGMLLMGKDQRVVKIKNTDEKSRWLSGLVDEMRSIMGGVPAVPAPALYKCKSCDVREQCAWSAYDPQRDPKRSREKV